ncbi:LptF/LptG family permease [Devosia sp.]|uniref:LptF/LptG family permease n=1 Tax=Devosia sp. TaxID=1871048 RepID=UPI0032634B6F
MTRIDWLVMRRVGSRIAVMVLIFYGIIGLIESLDTWRFTHVAEMAGTPMAVVMVMASAVRWTIKTLPVTVLMGAILGIIDLKNHRELTVIKASGISIWRIVRAPVIALVLLSLVISIGLETVSTQINRSLNPTPPGEVALLTPPGEVWLEQRSGESHYIILALGMASGGTSLSGVTVFNLGDDAEKRIEANEAKLEGREWVFPTAVVRTPDAPPRALVNYRLPTSSTPAELSLKLSSTEDMTFFELADLLRRGVADASIRTAAAMRVIKLLALPLVLAGSLFIAFAFTAGYRRSDKYGIAILYGIVLGFVVFVITEMADRAGSSGVLDPAFAAIGPAFVAIVIGVTVLLHKEDGQA